MSPSAFSFAGRVPLLDKERCKLLQCPRIARLGQVVHCLHFETDGLAEVAGGPCFLEPLAVIRRQGVVDRGTLGRRQVNQ